MTTTETFPAETPDCALTYIVIATDYANHRTVAISMWKERHLAEAAAGRINGGGSALPETYVATISAL